MERKLRILSLDYRLIFAQTATLPTNENRINSAAPSCRAFLDAILVISRVCIFSVSVTDPVPVPQSPASKLANPSMPIPLLTIPGVGGFKFTNNDVAWYEPIWMKYQIRKIK